MVDQGFRIASDGFVYIAVGSAVIKAHATRYNFMPWDVTTRKGVVLHRNMLARSDYPGSISAVPTLDFQSNPDNTCNQDASSFIGDYAPTGVNMSRSEFMQSAASILPVP